MNFCSNLHVISTLHISSITIHYIVVHLIIDLYKISNFDFSLSPSPPGPVRCVQGSLVCRFSLLPNSLILQSWQAFIRWLALLLDYSRNSEPNSFQWQCKCWDLLKSFFSLLQLCSWILKVKGEKQSFHAFGTANFGSVSFYLCYISKSW